MRRLLIVVIVLAAGCAEPGEPSGGASGIRGRVVAAPTCPVETGDPACDPRPVEARVYFRPLDRSGEKRVESEPDGAFTVSLPSGEYEIRAEPIDSGQRLTPRPITVTVTEGSFTRVQVILDTGIRTPTGATP